MLSLSTSEFLEGAKSGNTGKVKELLDANPGLANIKSSDGVSALILALYHGHKETAEVIASRKAELDIFEASCIGKLDLVKTLVNRQPSSAAAYSPDGFPVLALAAYSGQETVVDFLLQCGANVNAVANNSTGFTAFTGALEQGHRAIVKLLLANGANVNHRYETGFAPLMIPAQNGDKEMVKLLLESGADPNAKTHDGKTALAYATEKGHREVVALLKERGAK